MKKSLLPFALFYFLTLNLFSQVWEPKAFNTLPNDYYVSSISIVSDQVIWAVAYDYAQPHPIPPTHNTKLLKSVDGGETWEVKDIEEAMGRVSTDIHAFDENTACITTQTFGPPWGLGISRTTDGGETWTEVLSGNAGGVWLHFFDDQEGICINSNDMAKTTDGGMSWNPGNISGFQPSEGTIGTTTETSLETLGDRLWFGTEKGRVFKSLDRGDTWEAFASGLGNTTTIFSIAFVDEKNGLALYFNDSGDNQLAKSSDGGESWTALDYEYKFNEVIAIPCSRVFMGVSWEDSLTAISTDLGETWKLLNDQTAPWAPTFNSPNLGWIGEGGLNGINTPALYKWVGTPVYGRTYVNQNASGNNDGSSWADAYTDLQVAITNAEEGDEIWVGEGTYKPAAPGGSSFSTFLINKNLVLLGGFAGTECDLSERDIEQYPTILSGDLNGNDVPDDFDNYRDDNVTNVVRITNATTDATIIDGFIISGGHADLGFTSGGGIQSLGTPTIRNCIFEQNFAKESGGALSQSNNTTATFRLENCIFQYNLAKAGEGLGLHITASDFDVTNCIFRYHYNPDTLQGGNAAWIDRSSGTMRNCQFNSNKSNIGNAGLSVWDRDFSNPNPVHVEILDCTFEGNSTLKESGILSGSLILVLARDSSSITVKGCSFLENNGMGNGGGISLQFNTQAYGASMLVDSCLFSQNTALYNGSGIHSSMFGDSSLLEIRRCSFLNNISTMSSGALTLWGADGGSGTALVDDCHFEGNYGVTGGGLWLGGSDNTITIDRIITNCTFRNNEATRGGGVMLGFAFNLQSDIVFDNCVFEGNKATDRGGAFSIGANSNSGPLLASIKRTVMRNNESPIGAAVDYNHKVVLENCLVAENSSPNGVIYTYSNSQIDLLNCTVAHNLANALEVGDSASVHLQNTILYNPGYVEFVDFIGDATANSLGGNLIGDGSLNSVLTFSDKPGADPLFAGIGDYHVRPGSPCVDMGVDMGNLPALDLDGLPRVFGTAVDIGAYESPFVPVREVVVGTVSISPNPAVDFVNLQVPEIDIQSFRVQVFDAQGKLAIGRVLPAGEQLEVQHLQSGQYSVKVHVEERVFVGRFVKW